MYWSKAVMIVRMYRYTYPVVSGWYVVVKKFQTLEMLQKSWKKLNVMALPLPDSNSAGGAFFNTHSLVKCHATSSVESVFITTVFKNLLKWSEMTGK